MLTCRRTVLRFLCDRRGNVLMITGAVILALVAAAGIGVDLGRQQLVRLKLQQATDAAALAAASMPNNATNQQRQDAALRVFHMNYPVNYLGTGNIEPQITIAANGSITVEANQDVLRASFLRVVGQNVLRGYAVTRVEGSLTKQFYDVALVVDNSGSMQCGVNDLVNNLAAYDACKNNPNGPRRLNVLKQTASELTDTLLAPGAGGSGDSNRMALVRWSDYFMGASPFTNSRLFMITSIMSMVTGNGTNSSLGMGYVDGTLAPQYMNGHVKAAILLTDGVNTSFPNAPGCNGGNFCPQANAATLTQCTSLKNKGIIVYTIAFGRDVTNSPDAPQVRAFLQQCATQSPDGNNEGEYFYPAPDDTALSEAFKQIAGNIQTIRITQ